MNKQQLIEKIAAQAKLSPQQAEAALSATFECIKQIIANEDSIQIVGFGRFGSKVRAARKGRNPRTGEEIQIAETIVPYFKAGSQLKAAVKILIEQEK